MIIAAAIKATVEDKQVCLHLHRHCDFWDMLKQLGLKYDKLSVQQGFIDYTPEQGERFVNRVEAMKIARENHQLLHDDVLSELYSEDVW